MPNLKNYTNPRSPGVQNSSRSRAALALLFCIITTSACAQSALRQIVVEPAAGLPSEFVSEVDILFVYDANLLNQLPFTQFDWVSSKNSYLDREDNLFDMIQLTIKADSPGVQVLLPDRANEAAGVLVFASHEDPVAEALDISFESSILLQIESYGINVQQR